MVGKKKKSTKKKKSVKKSESATNLEGNAANDDMGTPERKKSGKKKKSTKKGKMSLAEKTLVKLEKGVELLKSDRHSFEHFVQIADAWLIEKGKKLKDAFLKSDGGDGIVTYDEMKSALYDMNCPMNLVEIHLLCKTLDSDNSGDIDYMNLPEGLRFYMKLAVDEAGDYTDDSDDDGDVISFNLSRGQSAKDIKHCTCCKVGLWLPHEPEIRYAEVTMLLITFADTFKKHPCHFTKVVHTHLTIYGLIQLVKEEVAIQSSTITVFRDKSRSQEAELARELTLEECGYEGREWHNPLAHVLYYDYTSEFNKCPILLCDHYFTDTLHLS